MRERGRDGYEVTQHYEAKTGTNECQQSKEKADTIRCEAKTGTSAKQASKEVQDTTKLEQIQGTTSKQ